MKWTAFFFLLFYYYCHYLLNVHWHTLCVYYVHAVLVININYYIIKCGNYCVIINNYCDDHVTIILRLLCSKEGCEKSHYPFWHKNNTLIGIDNYKLFTCMLSGLLTIQLWFLEFYHLGVGRYIILFLIKHWFHHPILHCQDVGLEKNAQII